VRHVRTGVALRAGAQFLWTPDFRTISNPWIAGRVQIGQIFIGEPQLVAGAICLLSFVALLLFVTRTETGLACRRPRRTGRPPR